MLFLDEVRYLFTVNLERLDTNNTAALSTEGRSKYRTLTNLHSPWRSSQDLISPIGTFLEKIHTLKQQNGNLPVGKSIADLGQEIINKLKSTR